MLAAVAVMGVSCNPPAPTPEPEAEKLTASVTPSEITDDGESKAVFTVKYGDKAVTNVKAFVNGAETALNNLTFTTKTAGTYKFYFEYEWSTGKNVKSNEVTVTAKAAEQSGDASGLTMTVDKTIIQAGKDRAIFTIKFNGKVVESGYTMYQNDAKVTLSTTEVEIDGKKYKQPYFESKTTGSYSFYVSYNITENTKKTPITVQVNNDAIPDRAEDPDPNSTSFKRRAMVMQFTGTACPNCPYLIEPLEQMAKDANYKDLFTWAAIHTYNVTSDPAAPCESEDQNKMGSTFGISGYPTVLVDIGTKVMAYSSPALNLSNLQKAVDNAVANPASAGISAAMTLDENNRVLTARVSVKAKDSKVYRVGMWLLEDNIKGGQSGSTTITEHNHAVRYVARAEGSSSVNYYGYELNGGKAMSAGSIVDQVFTINIKNQSVKLANCKVLIYVTTSTGNSYTVVNSVVSKDLKTAVPFEYAN